MVETEIIEELLYLEELRKSGVTNMFGATPYLQEQFGIGMDRARDILIYWMRNYDRLREKYKWR